MLPLARRKREAQWTNPVAGSDTDVGGSERNGAIRHAEEGHVEVSTRGRRVGQGGGRYDWGVGNVRVGVSRVILDPVLMCMGLASFQILDDCVPEDGFRVNASVHRVLVGTESKALQEESTVIPV